MKSKSDTSGPVYRSHRGPKIFMSDKEYASVKRRAAHVSLSINKYIRHVALTCNIGADAVHGLADTVDSVGHKFNDLVHFINRGGHVSAEQIRWILMELERILNMIPETTWVRVYHTSKGSGKRQHWGWVRGSLDEISRIKERAELVGLSQSGFVRAAALQGPLGRKVWTNVLLGLRRWRSNLEQVCYAPEITSDLILKSGGLSRRIVQLNVELTSGKKYRGTYTT